MKLRAAQKRLSPLEEATAQRSRIQKMTDALAKPLGEAAYPSA
jgi:hypothetical protein